MLCSKNLGDRYNLAISKQGDPALFRPWKLVEAHHPKQLPNVRTLSLVAYSESHSVCWIFHIEDVAHSCQDFGLRLSAPPPIVEHGMGFPVAIGISVLRLLIAKAKLKLVRRRF
jgi:hypothetical protein